MQVWRADMRRQVVRQEQTTPSWERLGGRGLIAHILLDKVPPDCDSLGPHNKLIWAPGLLVGHRLSSCDRISVGGKSPLTGGVKESNAGGTTGLMLAHLGIKALLIEAAPMDDLWHVLLLDSRGGRFEPADDLAGDGVYQTAEKIRHRYGSGIGVALIGPGGQRQMLAAGIQNLDKDDEPSRINARGGLGALMGSKRLLAVVIDSSSGEPPRLVNEALFKRAQKHFVDKLLKHPQTTVYADYGTASMTMMCDGFGALPTRNFSSGTFEDAQAISGDELRDLLLERGGESQTTHACMVGCTIRCSNCFADASGKKIVSPIEYETIALLGSNLGIADLDVIARLNWELNDLGLDTIEIGAALGVAAEAGLMEFGDGERALALVEEIRRDTPLGRTLGNGAAFTGSTLGVRRVPAVKGQAISAYDPRALKGTGVTYATSPQGADHTAGLTIRAKVNHLDPQDQVDISRKAQINMAGYDTLGACLFSGFGFADAPGTIRDLLIGRYGWDVPDDILQHLGEETLQLERAFNRAAGFSAADDRLPEWMTTEPLPPHNRVFDVDAKDLDGV